MKNIITCLGTGLLTLAIAVNAAAANGQGAYVEGNLGYGKVNETLDLGNFKFSRFFGKTDNKGLLANAAVGYQFNPFLALEVGLTRFADEDFPFGLKGKNNYTGDVAAKGILPLTSSLNLFGKVGVAAVHHELNWLDLISETKTKPAAFFGAGLGYDLTSNISVQVQGIATTKNQTVPAMYGVMGGLAFHF